MKILEKTDYEREDIWAWIILSILYLFPEHEFLLNGEVLVVEKFFSITIGDKEPEGFGVAVKRILPNKISLCNWNIDLQAASRDGWCSYI